MWRRLQLVPPGAQNMLGVQVISATPITDLLGFNHLLCEQLTQPALCLRTGREVSLLEDQACGEKDSAACEDTCGWGRVKAPREKVARGGMPHVWTEAWRWTAGTGSGLPL